MSNAKSINKVILVGRLGGDPKLHHLRQKRPYCTFDIATQGLKVTDTAWHSVVVYGKLAEQCHADLRKGSLVYLEGILQGRVWQDRTNVKHKTYSVYPKIVQPLESRPRFERSQDSDSAANGSEHEANDSSEGFLDGIDEVEVGTDA